MPLKIGRGNVDEDISRLRSLFGCVGVGVGVRVRDERKLPVKFSWRFCSGA